MAKRRIKFKPYSKNEETLYNQDFIDLILPIGSVIAYSGSSINNIHFMICNGDEISRADYNKLFTIIGTTYGKGDGTTTFNLPNLTGKFLEGALDTVGLYKDAGLPNIEGELRNIVGGNATNDGSGAFSGKLTYDKMFSSGSSHSRGTFTFDASKSNSIYGNSDTVQPNSLTMNYIIRVL